MPHETVFCYEQVETEYVYGGRLRADIALIQAGQVVGTLEIFVSHRAEQNKIDYHVSHGLPCLEMRAGDARTIQPPILIRPSAAYGLPEYTCEDCLAVVAKQRERQAALDASFICGRLISVFDRERWRKTIVAVEYLRQQDADGQPQVLQKITPFYSFRLDSHWYPDEQVSSTILSIDTDEKTCVNRSFTEYKNRLIGDRSFLGYRSGWRYSLFDFERALESTLPMSIEDKIRYFRIGYNTLTDGREPPPGFGFYDVGRKKKSSLFSDSLARILYGK